MQTMSALLPDDLRERVTSQLTTSTLTYPALREFVLAQVARREIEKAGLEAPVDLDMADHEDWTWEGDDQAPCFWTTPAGRWGFVPRKGNNKGKAKPSKGEPGLQR